MKNFCETYDLTNLITEPTCFKSVENPSSIDVILTNRKESFENSTTVETGLSDCHRMTLTVMKRYYKKLEPCDTSNGLYGGKRKQVWIFEKCIPMIELLYCSKIHVFDVKIF